MFEYEIVCLPTGTQLSLLSEPWLLEPLHCLLTGWNEKQPNNWIGDNFYSICSFAATTSISSTLKKNEQENGILWKPDTPVLFTHNLQMVLKRNDGVK